MVQMFDLVFREVSVWLSAMPSAVPLFPTVAWSLVCYMGSVS